MAKSRILIIGATGYIGPYLARASVAAGHPTFVLIRPETAINPAKAELIKSFKDSGIVILKGSLEDYESLLDAVRQVDIVISSVSTAQLLDQVKILKAIKEVCSIKRFVPSEFGSNQVSLDALPDPLKTAYGPKQQIRLAVASEGIPFTVVFSYGFAGFFLANLGQLNSNTPPRDKVVIFGDGNAKGNNLKLFKVHATAYIATIARTLEKFPYFAYYDDIMSFCGGDTVLGSGVASPLVGAASPLPPWPVICVTEEDIASCTIAAADDPRTENKYVHIRHPNCILSQNEMVSLWEKKLGKSLEKTHMSGESVLSLMEEIPYPKSIGVALRYTVFVRGSHFMVKMGMDDVEATELLPEVGYTSASKYLDSLI